MIKRPNFLDVLSAVKARIEVRTKLNQGTLVIKRHDHALNHQGIVVYFVPDHPDSTEARSMKQAECFTAAEEILAAASYVLRADGLNPHLKIDSDRTLDNIENVIEASTAACGIRLDRPCFHTAR